MSRCRPHRSIEPCFYCERGMQPFNTTVERLEALEARVKELERSDKSAETVNVSQAIGVIRDYALGDLVMLSPSLKRLKEKNPARQLILVTDPGLFDVLAGADYLDAILPKEGYEFANFHRTYNLIAAVETECGGKCSVKKYLTQSRPNLFAELLDVEGDAEFFPLPVHSGTLNKMRTMVGGYKTPLIGLACTCHSTVRVMPPEYVEPLARKLLELYGGTVVLIGKTEPWNQELADIKIPNVINLINATNIGELIAVCSLMNAMVSPDTGSMHIAGALGVKCLAVMGNNNPKNFSDFYTSVEVLQPSPKELSCVPCNDRSIPCLPLPKGEYGGECMKLMTPDRIAETFRGFYNGINIAYLHDTPLSYIGGAEITTKGMLKAGLERGYNVRMFNNESSLEQLNSLYGFDLIILSNIWRFNEDAMSIIMGAIRQIPYVKYDHDHDSLGDKALGKWPKDEYAAKIFRDSALNVFVSPAHMADYKDMAVGICIPELIDEAMFKPVPEVKRKKGTALIGVPRKWGPGAIAAFRDEHKDFKVDVLDRVVPHKEMPALYSQYEYFAHYPQGRWPCDRVIYESALCGCKVLAGKNVEALSWERDLTDPEGLREWLREVPGKFWKEIGTIVQKVKHG